MTTHLLHRIAGILYPARCALCDDALAPEEKFLCPDCREKLDLRPRLFPGGFAAFAYSGAVQRSILRLKYGGREEIARFYARAIAYAGRDLLRKWDPQAVVPVPIHPRRLATRGYNQAEEIGRELARLMRVPLRANLLCRVRNTRAQKGLGHREREENLAGAFAGILSADIPERVLLVDDIYTSGATAAAAMAALRAAGASGVHVVCAALAKTDG